MATVYDLSTGRHLAYSVRSLSAVSQSVPHILWDEELLRNFGFVQGRGTSTPVIGYLPQRNNLWLPQINAVQKPAKRIWMHFPRVRPIERGLVSHCCIAERGWKAVRPESVKSLDDHRCDFIFVHSYGFEVGVIENSAFAGLFK